MLASMSFMWSMVASVTEHIIVKNNNIVHDSVSTFHSLNKLITLTLLCYQETLHNFLSYEVGQCENQKQQPIFEIVRYLDDTYAYFLAHYYGHNFQ